MGFRGIGIMTRFVGLNSCLWIFILSGISFLRCWRVSWGLRCGGKDLRLMGGVGGGRGNLISSEP
jgi:hypothetical protein